MLRDAISDETMATATTARPPWESPRKSALRSPRPRDEVPAPEITLVSGLNRQLDAKLYGPVPGWMGGGPKLF